MSKNWSLKRGKPKRLPFKRFLIVCEGEKSEPDYLNGIKPLCRVPLVEIEVVGGAGVTKTVVQTAVKRKKEAEIRARKSGNGFENYDEVWCVIDVDDHPKLDEALQQARDNNVKVALSNPCFELWVILHHRDERKAVDRSKLQSECARHHKRSDKHVPFELLWPLYETAKKNASALRKWQVSVNRSRSNPWTDFDLLVEAILELRRS